MEHLQAEHLCDFEIMHTKTGSKFRWIIRIIINVRGFESRACRQTSCKRLMPALCVSVPHRCIQCRCECSWKTLRPSERTLMEVPCIGEPHHMHVKTNTLYSRKGEGCQPGVLHLQVPNGYGPCERLALC